MSWIADAIAEFGQSIGIPELALSAGGRLRMSQESGGYVGMVHLAELRSPVLMVCRSSALAYQAATQLAHALQLTDFRRGRPWPLQVAVSGGQLYLALRLPERSVTRAALDQAVIELAQLHAEIGNAGRMSR